MTTKPVEVEAAAPEAADPFALINSMAGKADGKKKKSGSPQILAPELKEPTRRFLEAKAKMDAAESELTMAADQLRTAAVPLRVKWCRENQRVEASIRINGEVSLTSMNKYSPVQAEHIQALGNVFGEDTKRYFAPQLKIAVNESAAADPVFLNALIKAVGPEEFAKRFKVDRTFAVTEAFHHDVTLKPEVAEKAAPFMASEIVKHYTESLKP